MKLFYDSYYTWQVKNRRVVIHCSYGYENYDPYPFINQDFDRNRQPDYSAIRHYVYNSLDYVFERNGEQE